MTNDAHAADPVVVVIDDHPGAARGLAALLSRIGCSATSTTSARQGIDLCRRYRPNAVLLDIALPDLDGFAVLAALRREPSLRETRFIAMSSDAEEVLRSRARSAGFHHFVKKPGSLELFRSLLGV